MDFHVTDPNDTRVITFTVPTKDTLNSNRMPRVTFVKSQRARDLRLMGSRLGVENHETPDLAQRFLKVTSLENTVITQRSALRKKMNKSGASPDDIDVAMLKVHDDIMGAAESKEDIGLAYMLYRFNVDVKVFAPTKKLFDPPNFYPTIKPFIDGMTDSGWWVDDNYNYLDTMSFSCGGVQKNDDNAYTFELTFSPLILDGEHKDDDRSSAQ